MQSYPFTPYETKLSPGYGHTGAFRISDFQAVRPKHEHTFSVFRNGNCIESCIPSEKSARDFILTILNKE